MLFAIVVSVGSVAQAQELAGNYRLLSDSTAAEVPEWGSDCGQRPESHRGSSGRTVRVSMDGSNLVIEDRPRMRSDGCWSQNPRVRRTGGSGSAPRWTSQCATPADDYQHEEATYTTTVEGDHLVLRDRTLYSWQLRTSNCRATLTRVMTFERVEDAQSGARDSGVVVAQVVRDAGVVRAPARCALPGPASRLSITSRQRSAAPGSRVCFRAQLLDPDGCLAINSGSAVITWSITKRNGETVPGEGGCMTVPPNTERNTEYSITASASGFEDHVALRVVSAEEFRSLVAQSIEDDDAGAPTVIAAPTVTDAVGAMTPAPVTPAPPNTTTRNIVVAVLTALAVALLALVAVLGMRKKPVKKQAFDATDLDDEPTRQAVTPLPFVTPHSGQSRPPRARKDEIPMSPRDMPIGGLPPMSMQAGAAVQSKKAPNPLAKVMVQPTPSGGLPHNAASSPAKPGQPEAAAAAPAAAVVAPAAAVIVTPQLTKRCPTCDQRFSEENAFCPEHGVVLVAVGSGPARPVEPAVKPSGAGARNDRIQKQTMFSGSVGSPTAPVVATSGPQPATAAPAGNAVQAFPLRCPVCGKSFGPENIFCGEDGSRLERV